MTNPTPWSQHNSDYLSAAIAWVRHRFERPATKEKTFPAPAGAMRQLVDRFGLTSFEQQLLVLAAACELDTQFGALCAAAQNDANRIYPTFALALTMLDEPSWEALSPEAPLRFWRMLELTAYPQQSLLSAPLRLDERILHCLKGLNDLDARLSPLLVPLTAMREDGRLATSQYGPVQETVSRWRYEAGGTFSVVQLVGSDSASKESVACQAAAELGQLVFRMAADLIPATPVDADALARLWQREAALSPVALLIDGDDTELAAGSPISTALRRFLYRLNAPIFLSVSKPWAGAPSGILTLAVDRPTLAEQRIAWQRSLPGTAEVADMLAGHFNLNLNEIDRVANRVAGDAEVNPNQLADRAWQSCREHLNPRLDSLAQRIETEARWEDLILPPEQSDLLRRIAAQVRHRTRVHQDWGFRQKLTRGLGISALFAGDSGVGKTFAAEVLANELRLSLYRIDLSCVVSKYIGETEVNLRKIFDAAEQGGTMLFFDEADALFGKRSEVKDSHDCYANIEINYLLQRMESYNGVAILATNMKNAMDTAFTRRLRFIVHFPFPASSQRRQLWTKAWGAGTPLGVIDYDRLARFTLTGGTIQNIALQAVFRAAEAGSTVGMPEIFAATRAEFRKMDRPFSEAEFQLISESGAVA